MCLGLFGSKPKAPVIPAPPPVPAPPPTPQAVDSQAGQQDMASIRRKQMRAGLAGTIKSSGIFGTGSEFSSLGTGKNTLGG
jgi:hypothetical protein